MEIWQNEKKIMERWQNKKRNWKDGRMKQKLEGWQNEKKME